MNSKLKTNSTEEKRYHPNGKKAFMFLSFPTFLKM
jgi:hypothetical protein